MGLFERFPYTNFHELNAGWLLKKMDELIKAMENFKATESLKFADPIIWDITTQYQKSTIVLDPTGNAYLSVKPVPAGVQLNNDEYWLEIFNFTDYTRTANNNLTAHVETNTTRATAAYNVDDWLIWEDVLYKVTAAIAIDDALVVGTNLVHFTVEDFIKAWVLYANGLIQQYKNDIDASELAYRNQLAQDISNTTATLTAQFNQAIAGVTVDSEVIDARIGYNSKVYATLGDAIRSQISDIWHETNYNSARKQPTQFNMYNAASITPGCYIDYSSGNLVANANYATSDYIEIEENNNYFLYNGNQQLALFDKDRNYLTGYANANTFNSATTPTGAKYLRFCMPNADISAAYCLERNARAILNIFNSGAMLPYSDGIIADKLADDLIHIELSCNSVALLKGIIAAIDAQPLPLKYTVDIYMAEGNYNFHYSDVSDYYPAYGLVLPDNVNIYGQGTGAKFRLDLTGEAASVQQTVSTINVNKNNIIDNCTFEIVNGRYAMHNDSGGVNTNIKQKFTNCRFIFADNSAGAWAYPAAVGEGTSSGADVTYENCDFLSVLRGYFLHNNTSFTKPSKHTFKHCHFAGLDSDSISLALQSLNSGQIDLISFEGCTFNQIIDNRAGGGGITHSDYYITASGCDFIPYFMYYTDPPTERTQIHSEYMITYRNNSGATISHLRPVKHGAAGVEPLAVSDNVSLVYGVAIGDTANNDFGLVVTGGLIDVSNVPGVYMLGQKIGINNGALAVVNNNHFLITCLITRNRKFAKFV